ncbi:hypothetical protein NDU88_000616 [Pleurodeles waltl]|uniref:Uncharacterized protein n=1 Tax=Pleurodeles waltl TaxID=8319 RepID=A0AAV7R7A8_PLEWA|nr:hypothetical protein NDU88_000616 [Pleurodeles waltl]
MRGAGQCRLRGAALPFPADAGTPSIMSTLTGSAHADPGPQRCGFDPGGEHRARESRGAGYSHNAAGPGEEEAAASAPGAGTGEEEDTPTVGAGALTSPTARGCLHSASGHHYLQT